MEKVTVEKRKTFYITVEKVTVKKCYISVKKNLKLKWEKFLLQWKKYYIIVEKFYIKVDKDLY